MDRRRMSGCDFWRCLGFIKNFINFLKTRQKELVVAYRL
ncbi:hypothetical protein LEP1GSC125_0608 [Leptospira mayottensis 200901122]|uniref:Uncharacterized protein n=1 Tax=Leptospira mayottensis 200901122 TaxID=1193010 RepID=A0AA87MQ59_9LEPT|nr:hypothetical protein LEP1GSC125_0608 [Leptospira mayottensis 200901122]